MKVLIYLLAFAATVTTKTTLDVVLRKSQRKFTSDIFQEVIKVKPGKSFVVSAFSVMSPLAQLAVASVGKSRKEIIKAIALPNNDTLLSHIFCIMHKQAATVKGAELHIANKMFVRKGNELNEQFDAISRNGFFSEVKDIDFSQNEEAVLEINRWVEENTNFHIKDLVSSPIMMDRSTAAVLVNAIYFKGTWKKAFDKTVTTDETFKSFNNHNITVPMMKQLGTFKYGDCPELLAKLVELQYEGDQCSLLIILPDSHRTYNYLIEFIKNPIAISRAVNKMRYQDVLVELPKIKIETTTDLDVILKRINIQKIFSPSEARLENLLKGDKNVFISAAIQKAYIDLNEDGIEAAPSNVLESLGSNFKLQAKHFNADHPFYFEVRLNTSVLFNGIYAG